VDGDPVGRLYIDRRKTEIRIIDIAILPAFRSHGIGTQVLNWLFAEADNVQLPVSIHVEKYNRALHWYQRLGFQQLEDQGVYLLMERRPTPLTG